MLPVKAYAAAGIARAKKAITATLELNAK